MGMQENSLYSLDVNPVLAPISSKVCPERHQFRNHAHVIMSTKCVSLIAIRIDGLRCYIYISPHTLLNNVFDSSVIIGLHTVHIHSLANAQCLRFSPIPAARPGSGRRRNVRRLWHWVSSSLKLYGPEGAHREEVWVGGVMHVIEYSLVLAFYNIFSLVQCTWRNSRTPMAAAHFGFAVDFSLDKRHYRRKRAYHSLATTTRKISIYQW